MKQFIFTFFISLFSILFLNLPLIANNIDTQIEAIQKAPIEERFKLMNSFKKEIVQMREEERIQAMSKLQSITQSKHADKAFKELRTRTRVRHTKEHIRTREELRPNMDQENDTKDNVETTTEDSVENETEDQTEDSVENQTEDQTENETEDSVENETEEHEVDEHDND